MWLPISFQNQLLQRALSTVVATIIIAGLASLTYFFFKTRLENDKQKMRLLSRLRYSAIVLLLLVLMRIWFEGFSHLLTMLSLIGAGLVVTNKESIMNFVGGLIINWRGLFVEGDFIQIQNYAGYVAATKPLYFKLYEATNDGSYQVTGKTILVPNGTVITSPVSTFSPDSNLSIQRFSLPLDFGSNLEAVLEIARKILADTLLNYPIDLPKPSLLQLKKKNPLFFQFVHSKPTVTASVLDKNPKQITLTATYVSSAENSSLIEEAFLMKFIKATRSAGFSLST